ncbi:MAG: hypothetical protein JO360_05790 [Acidobacteria bacterium]|nr:hypothetical protein [Acidobacteriota bacterium]
MTDEERQRQMDFIVETLARITVRIDRLGERVEGIGKKVDGLAALQAQAELERKADAVRISRVEEALVQHSELFQRMVERLDVSFKNISQLTERSNEHDARIANVEDAIVVLKNLLNRSGNGTSGS